MNDGKIVFSTELDNKGLEKELASLKKKIQSLEDQLESDKNAMSPLVEQASKLEEQLNAAKAKLYEMQTAAEGVFSKEQIADQKESVASIQFQWNKVQGQVESYDKKIQKAAIELEKNKERAGEVAEQLAKVSPAAKKMAAAMAKAEKRARQFSLRMKEVLRSALIFTLISQGMAQLREWVGKVIKSNDEATAAVARLKGALLTLAQPLVDVLIPAFITAVNILTDFINVASRLVSFLFGTTIEASAEAAETLNKESEALDGVGNSAKKAEKALASFDEINRLSNNVGVAGGSSDSIAPDFAALKGGLTSALAFTMEDILFDWEDLAAEDILAKIVTALSTLAGAYIGFVVGGPGGAAIGLLVGAGIGMTISNLLFNGDGKLDPEEILKTLALALGTLAGGILGFVAGGGPGGAALGITLGAGVALALCGLVFNNDGVLNEEEILSSVIVALGALAGGIMGFALGGGIGGAKIGATIGAGIALSILGLFFDGDGQLDPEEIKASLAVALGAIVGGIIGFVALPGAGAAIGAIVGAGITAKIVDIAFDGGAGLSVDKLIGGLVEFLVALAGGLIGFFLGGGPVGAVIGAAIGVGLSLLIDKVFFSDKTGGNAGYDEGKEIGENVTDGAKDSLGVHSPSTEFQEIGGYMMQGMANGITSNSALPVNGFKAILATLQSEFTDWSTNFLTGFSGFGRVFTTDWTDLWKTTNIQFVYSWNDILSNFQNGINNAITALNKLVAAANELAGLTDKRYKYANRIVVDRLPIPKLAQGAVIPPNREFLAVLGDQKSGTNLEAPEGLIRQIVREEAGGGMNTRLLQAILDAIKEGKVLMVDRDEFAKLVYSANRSESKRIGISLANEY